MKDVTEPDPEVPERARGPRRYSAKYKAQILEEYEGLDKAGKGALLRREGLYTRYSPRHKETGLSPFLMECAKQGKTGRFEVLSIERIVPPLAVADRLQVPGDTASVLR